MPRWKLSRPAFDYADRRTAVTVRYIGFIFRYGGKHGQADEQVNLRLGSGKPGGRYSNITAGWESDTVTHPVKGETENA